MNASALSVLSLSGGLVLSLLGSLLLLVAAFRRSLLWGVGCFLLPFVSLIFIIRHWDEAKHGFLIGLVGTALAVGSLVGLPEVREQLGLPQFTARPAAIAAATIDLNTQIQQRRERLEQLVPRFDALAASLQTEYQTLEAQRQALKPDDVPAITQFNELAATYQRRNQELKTLQGEIAKNNDELSALLNQRAKERKPAAARIAETPDSAQPALRVVQPPPRVVMYTTSTCPACVAAKRYLTQKGVAFEELNVDTSMNAREEFRQKGGRGVPLIFIGDKRLEGFSSRAIDAAL